MEKFGRERVMHDENCIVMEEKRKEQEKKWSAQHA